MAEKKRPDPEPRLWRIMLHSWEKEFNEVPRLVFTNRLGRFRYDFLLVKEWVCSEEDFQAYLDYQEFDPNGWQAPISRKMLDEIAKENKWKEFYRLALECNVFTDLKNLLSNYPQIFLFNTP